MEVGVVYLFLVEYLEEVPHGGGTKCGECLSAYGDNESRVLVAKLNECREDGVRLSGSCAALVNLNLRLAFFNVVICRRELHRLQGIKKPREGAKDYKTPPPKT